MRLFDPRARQITPQQARRYAMLEILHTVADFLAAFLFIVGSILFFSEQTKVAATVCFLLGSLFFAAKPDSTPDNRLTPQTVAEAGQPWQRFEQERKIAMPPR